MSARGHYRVHVIYRKQFMDIQKKYVVTGAAGFIGAYLSRYLLENGFVSLKNLILVDVPSHFKDRECARRMTSDLNQCSILSPEDFEKAAASSLLPESVAGIFHMGASSSTEEMRADYLKKWNVDYSKKVWNFCHNLKIPLVYASSAATYGNGEQGFSDSPDIFSKLKPLNPYGQSKLEFDIWAHQESLADRQPPRWAGLRFFNVYGPGEEHKGGQASVVIHAREQILKNKSLKLFKSHKEGIADGFQKRDFVYVEDLCRVCAFFVFDRPKMNGIFNVGTGQARTFLDLAKACFQALGVKERIDFIPTPEKLREHYQYFTQADLESLRKSGYTSTFTKLEEGVSKTFQNYHG